jgi:membrane fusion protein (multidrug efflux system)
MRFFISLLVVPLLVVSACSPPDDATSADGSNTDVQSDRRLVRVEASVLKPSVFEDIIQLTGTVEAPNDAMLSAQTGGTVRSVAPLGRRVRAGDVVARLDASLIEATLEQARAQREVAGVQLDLAEGLLRRQEPLHRDSIISDLEFDNVRSQAMQAKSEVTRADAFVRQAETQLENTLVRAPFSGIVEERFVEQGEQLLPGSAVVRVVNSASVIATAGVPERYAGDVRVGSPVTIRFQASSDGERTGTVSFSSSVINPQNRTFRIEIELDNPGGALKPAMIVSLLITRVRLEDRLVVPQTAILRDENSSSVFVVNRSSGQPTAERRTIRTGASYGGRVVVEEGLFDGDEVIVVGQTNVTEGDAVEIAST